MNTCETRSSLPGITRRNLLILGGTSTVAMPFAGIPGFVTLAAGQERKLAPAVILPAEHFLARAGIAGAARFPIGTQALSLDLDPKSPHIGAVHEYTLPAKDAQVLGRKTSVIEASMKALTPDSASMKVVHNALTAYKDLPPAITKAHFAAVTTRRRVITPTTEADRLNISKELQTVEPVTMVVGFTADQRQGVTAYVLPPTVTSLKTKKLLRPPILFVPNLGKSGGGAAPPQAAPPPAATPEEFDFAKCFLDCAAGLYGTAAPFIAAMTPSCVTAIAALPATAGISSVLAVPACALDLVLLAAPVAICLAVCGVAAAAAG